MKHILATLIFFQTCFGFAQLDVFPELKFNTQFQAHYKKTVACVSEYKTVDNAEMLVSVFCTNDSGLTTQKITRSQSGFKRVTMTYDNLGKLLAFTEYDDEDTTKLRKITRFTYNKNFPFVDSVVLRYPIEGMWQTELEKQTSLLDKKDQLLKYSTRSFFRGNLMSVTISCDSTVGSTNYKHEYRFKEGDIDNKGRKHGKHFLERNYSQGDRIFQDRIEFEIYATVESPKDLKTSFKKYNEAKQLIETGEIDYTEAYTAFMQARAQNYNPYQISPLFVEALLNQQIQGQPTNVTKYRYNDKGMVVEISSDLSTESFEYNAQDLLIRYKSLTKPNDLLEKQFRYNDQQLISSVIVLQASPNGKTIDTTTSTFHYKYQYKH